MLSIISFGFILREGFLEAVRILRCGVPGSEYCVRGLTALCLTVVNTVGQILLSFWTSVHRWLEDVKVFEELHNNQDGKGLLYVLSCWFVAVK